MMIYVNDLEVGDKFDVNELMERQGIMRSSLPGGDIQDFTATVLGICQDYLRSDEYLCIRFKVEGYVNDWRLMKKQVVKVVSLVS